MAVHDDAARPRPRARRHTRPRGAASRDRVPFTVAVDTIAAMVNLELPDHPVYRGLEVQRFDDEVHGTGLAVLLERRGDRRVDVYHQPGLRLDRSGYGIGGGLGTWAEAEIAPAVLDVTDRGVRAEVALRDADGRAVELRVDDRGGRRRRPAPFLAPVGDGVLHPTELLLVWMSRFDLVRRRGPAPVVRIDGEHAAIGRLPGAWLHRRHLVKYAADLVAVRLNGSRERSHSGAGRPPSPGGGAERGEVTCDAHGTVVVGRAGHHEARLVLEPPYPEPTMLGPGRSASGTWRVDVDDQRAVVGGTWAVRSTGELACVELDVTQPWSPRGLPPLMRVVTRVAPVFRSWPTTYRWQATVVGGLAQVVDARWERSGRPAA